jgi:hypothetical protein
MVGVSLAPVFCGLFFVVSDRKNDNSRDDYDDDHDHQPWIALLLHKNLFIPI